MSEVIAFNLFSFSVFFTSFLFLVLIYFAFDRDNSFGKTYFCLLLLSCFLYSFFYGFELASISERSIVFFFSAEFIGGVFITPLWWAFVVKFTGNTKYLSSTSIILVFGSSIIFLSLILTNSFHGLFYKEISIGEGISLRRIYYEPGIFHWIYAAFNIVLVLISNFHLIQMVKTVPKIYSNQVVLLLMGTLLPFIVYVVDIMGFSPYNLNYVPYALAASSFIIYFGLYKFDLFKAAPIAFKTIFENLSDGILILDNRGEIITQNKSAITFFPDACPNGSINKQLLLTDWPQLEDVFKIENKSKNTELFDPLLSRTLLVYRENGTCHSKSSHAIHYIFIRDISKIKANEEIIKSNEQSLKDANALLLRNEKMLNSIALATKELLSNQEFSIATQKAIALLGEGAGVDRAYLFENHFDSKGKTLSSQRFEWSALGVPSEINNPILQDLPLELYGDAVKFLSANKVYQAVVSRITAKEIAELLSGQGIKSILLIPIFVENHFWGFVGFDDCTVEKEWTETEVALLVSFADSISNAVERKNLERSLFLSMQKANDASKAKSEFLANMSHEIRTPLNGVIGFSDLLMRSKLNETQNQYIKSIHLSGNLLLELINDILDFSKIEAGKMEINTVEVNLRNVANEAIMIIQPIAKKKSLDLKLSIDPNLPDLVFMDVTRLKQVLINLLSNSAKFTHSGEIELAIRLISQEEKEDESRLFTLEFSVKDTGIGISVDKKERVFEAFAQEDNSTTRKFGGSGLGLAISNKLLQLMESKLELETEHGKGSKFYFLLKLRHQKKKLTESLIPQMSSAIKTDSAPKYPSQKVYKILLADDNPINMFLAETIIKSLLPNSQIIEANNGLKAVEAYEKFKPDLVLMDIQMPEMSGYEATQSIREKNPVDRTPIIALTAKTVKGEKERCLEIGMNDYISKPVRINEISQILEKYFGDDQFFSLKDGTDSDDEAFHEKLVALSRNSLENSKIALIRHHADKNLHLVKQTVHSIKGIALNLHLEELALQASRFEPITKFDNLENGDLLEDLESELNQVIEQLERQFLQK